MFAIASIAFVDMRFAATPTANLKILFFHKAVRPRGKESLYLQMRLGGSCMKIIEYNSILLSYVVVVKAIDAIYLVL